MVTENMGQKRCSDCSFRICLPGRGLKFACLRNWFLFCNNPFLAIGRLLRWPPLLFQPMQPIKHHTIVTGHVRELVPEEYDPGIIKTTREAIDYALGETEPVALFSGLDPDVKFSFETFSGNGLKCTVYGKTGDPCVVFIVVGQSNSIARRQYAELLKMDNGPQRFKSRMPEAPFCSVALTKHLEETCNREMLKWVGDYEGCAAVAWLYGNQVLTASFPKGGKDISKIKENLYMWLILGVEEYTPTKEVVDLLGKSYLEKFISESLRLIGEAHIGGTLPVMQRLNQLRGMIK